MSADEVVRLFKCVTASSPLHLQQQGQQQPGNACSASGPSPLCADQRQSTFVRAVTQQLLEQLQVPTDVPEAAAAAAAGDACQQQQEQQQQRPSGSSSRRHSALAVAAPARSTSIAALSLLQFQQSLTQLTRACYPGIANAARAWRLLMQQHIQPLAAQGSRHDGYHATLSTPGVVALLTAWQPQLRQLFDSLLLQQQQQRGSQEQQQLHLAGVLALLQERHAIPQLLQPADVLEALRRLMPSSLHDMVRATVLRCVRFA